MSLIIILKNIFFIIVIILILFFVITVLINQSISSIGYKGKANENSDHFDGKRFWNIGEREGNIPIVEKTDEEEKFSIWSMFNRPKQDWSEIVTPEVSVPEKSEDLKVTFINHATALIQVNNKNILTDPIYSDRASPFSFIGPKRYTNPRISFENLPPIDVVILSHNHYDHMDLPTLKRLMDMYNPLIVTTLGNKQYLEDRGITNIVETDWWDETIIEGGGSAAALTSTLKIITVPAQHFSARGLTDRNVTLWAGYVVEASSTPPVGHMVQPPLQRGGTVRVYFAGDTGYGPFVEKIKEKYPEGFDYGLVPIGAYKPVSFMGKVHIAPIQAMQMMKDLNIKKAVAIHFGTFALALDKQTDPERDLEKLKQQDEYKNINLTTQK